MSSKIVNAVYDDDDTLLHAVKDVKKAEYRIEEGFTHFRVHRLLLLPSYNLANIYVRKC